MSDRRTLPVQVGKVSYGRGVFARRNFSRGDLIAEVSGKIIDDADYSSSTCIDLLGSLSMEPAAPFCYLNHACEPNCQFWLTDDAELESYLKDEDSRWLDEHAGEDRPRVVLECLRPIRRGEELTIDYGWPAEDAMPCACGGENCRGWIVAAEELPNVQRPQPA